MTEKIKISAILMSAILLLLLIHQTVEMITLKNLLLETLNGRLQGVTFQIQTAAEPEGLNAADLQDIQKQRDFINEITVFDFNSIISYSGGAAAPEIAGLSAAQSSGSFFYGTYHYNEGAKDVINIIKAGNSQKIVNYETVYKGNKVIKGFIPVDINNKPYVVGFVTDYNVIAEPMNRQYWNLGIMLVIGAVVCALLIYISLVYLRKYRVYVSSSYMQEMDRMFTTIRGQRHDFLNHVNTMKIMIDLDSWQALRNYATDLVGEIKDANNILRLGHPALSSIIHAKTADAKEKQIRFEHEIIGMEHLCKYIRTTDITKIIGNLIDNAFDEAVTLPINERWVKVKMFLKDTNLHIESSNACRFIDQKEINRFFEAGYSTRNDGAHSGLGLAIIKDRVEHHNGHIKIVYTGEGSIVFHIQLPLAEVK